MTEPTLILQKLVEHCRKAETTHELPPLELVREALASADPDTRIAGMYALDELIKANDPIVAMLRQPDFSMDSENRHHLVYKTACLAGLSEIRPKPTDDEANWLPAEEQDAKEKILIVHGTWASGGWWLPSSPFAMYLDTISNRALYKQADQFQWSGANTPSERRTSGIFLALWLKLHPHVDTIVAHSHGGNVTFVASRILASRGSVLRRVINLGTPARTDYPPDLRAIDFLANVYSFGDNIQTPFGTLPHCRGEGRSVSDSKMSVNVVADASHGSPGHSDLHEPPVWQYNNLEEFIK